MLESTALMADYDDFAWFYHRYWNEEFHSAAFPILERTLLPRIPKGARILDVCCGSGYLARLLTDRGYRVTGFDLSSSMIELARAYVPAATFEVADAATFRTRTRCDAAVSTFDSLNHILDPAIFVQAFRRVAASLKPGAPFAFDILREEAYRTDWSENFTLVRDDHVLLISGGGFNLQTGIAQCHITMFRLLDGTWRRSDVDVRERCYTAVEIDTALEEAGFSCTSCYDASDLGMGGQLGHGRIFYVSTRK